MWNEGMIQEKLVYFFEKKRLNHKLWINYFCTNWYKITTLVKVNYADIEIFLSNQCSNVSLILYKGCGSINVVLKKVCSRKVNVCLRKVNKVIYIIKISVHKNTIHNN